VPGSATEVAVRAAFAEQAGWCERLGSPFTALLCRVIGERISDGSAVGSRLLRWGGDPAPLADGLPLRLCGGLHFLVRRGDAPALAALYPPAAMPNADLLWGEIEAVLGDAALLPWLDRPPQTNEVGRSAALMAGLLAVAEAVPQPMALFELGASAGLNLLLDRYRYRLGDLSTGDPASPLELAPDWLGPPPPTAAISVVSRAGVDLQPLDARADAERLLAYLWPDQSQRLAQLKAALAIAGSHPPRIESGDAAEWLERHLPAPRPGVARVVLHSVAYQYFPAASQARVDAAVARAGETAGQSPVAWLRFEKGPEDKAFSLRLRLWPGGEDRLLAWCHPHATWIEWLSDGAQR
jgi:hypothetical protein